MASKKRSFMWDHFSENPKVPDSAVCNICKQKISIKGGATTNLKKHYQRKHPTINLTYPKNQASTPIATPATVEIPDSSTSNATSNTSQGTLQDFLLTKKIGAVKKRKIDSLILKMMYVDLQPFSIVEDKGFRELVHELNPAYQIPSRKIFSKTLLPAKFEELSTVIREELRSGLSFCATSDCWSSTTAKSFIAVTVHFLTEDFQQKSVLLSCREIKERHTAENLGQTIKEILEEWNVPIEKVNFFVTDNASNAENAIKKVLKLKHFGCFAHSLNLVMKEALESVQELLEKVRGIVRFFKKSNVGNYKLEEYFKARNEEPSKLIQDVPTRWNSSFYCLKRFGDMESALRSVMGTIDHDFPILSVSEWRSIKELAEVLEPFESATREVSQEKHLSGSLVLPLRKSLIGICQTILQDPIYAETTKRVIKTVQEQLNKRFSNYENSQTLGQATFLDPRFKNVCFMDSVAADNLKKK